MRAPSAHLYAVRGLFHFVALVFAPYSSPCPLVWEYVLYRNCGAFHRRLSTSCGQAASDVLPNAANYAGARQAMTASRLSIFPESAVISLILWPKGRDEPQIISVPSGAVVHRSVEIPYRLLVLGHLLLHFLQLSVLAAGVCHRSFEARDLRARVHQL